MKPIDLLRTAPPAAQKEFALKCARTVEQHHYDAVLINNYSGLFLAGNVTASDLKEEIDDSADRLKEVLNDLTAVEAMAWTVALNAARFIAGDEKYLHTISNNACFIAGRFALDKEIKRLGFHSEESDKAQEEAERNEEKMHIDLLNSILRHTGD